MNEFPPMRKGPRTALAALPSKRILLAVPVLTALVFLAVTLGRLMPGSGPRERPRTLLTLGSDK